MPSKVVGVISENDKVRIFFKYFIDIIMETYTDLTRQRVMSFLDCLKEVNMLRKKCISLISLSYLQDTDDIMRWNSNLIQHTDKFTVGTALLNDIDKMIV
jgi:hypothetical protein